jgi:hypothetical protein
VALCGDNLVMSTVAATLQQKFPFHVRQMDASGPDRPDESDAGIPDVLVFDLATVASDSAIRWLREYPGILLIGVDLTGNKMLVLSGQQSRFLTVEDLARVLEAESP